MGLSAGDRRVLADMEHHLVADDPGLAGLLTGFGRHVKASGFPSSPVRVLAVGVVAVACPALCVLAVTVRDPAWLAVIGTLLFILGGGLLTVGMRPRLARWRNSGRGGTSRPTRRRSGGR